MNMCIAALQRKWSGSIACFFCILIFRYAEGFDIEYSTDHGPMYSFYKKARSLLDGENVDEADTDPPSINIPAPINVLTRNISISPQISPSLVSNHSMISSPVLTCMPALCTPSKEISSVEQPQAASFITSNETINQDDQNPEAPIEFPNTPKSPQPSTSRVSANVSTWEYSPFKNHLKIADCY